MPDLCRGYYQISMAEEDKERIAFICPLGVFHLALTLTFQRRMEKAVGNMRMLEVTVYL